MKGGVHKVVGVPHSLLVGLVLVLAIVIFEVCLRLRILQSLLVFVLIIF
jgi:hypothetical protein